MGDSQFISLSGSTIDAKSLRHSKAQALARLTFSQEAPYPFVTPIECRIIGEGATAVEVLVLDVEVSLSQQRLNPILPVERIAVLFNAKDEVSPEARALRKDFPNVPHLNPTLEGMPRSLCLTDQPFAEGRLRWTAKRFIERVRDWLSLTSEGILHQGDQPLEPLLAGAVARIIIPFDLFEEGEHSKEITPISCYRANSEQENSTPVVVALRSTVVPEEGPNKFVLLPFNATTAMTHGVISHAPKDIAELDSFLKPTGIEFIGQLRTFIRSCTGNSNLLGSYPILVVAIPKRRSDASQSESMEIVAFWPDRSVGEIGVAIGALGKQDNLYVPLILVDATLTGIEVRLDMAVVHQSLSRESAAIFSGVENPSCYKIVAIGIGALGSQVFDNLTRSGFGEWTIVDNDVLLPHNLVRHELTGRFIGHPKVLAMAVQANATIDGPPIVSAIADDVLHPHVTSDALQAAYLAADVIFDMSASVAVARKLARDLPEVPARRISAFLSPTGNDLAIIAEDEERKYRLDSLEMQYYRAVAGGGYLEGHLNANSDSKRYGLGCRDVSFVLAPEQVALHAAIATRAIRTIASKPTESSICVWRTRSDTLETFATSIRPSLPVEYRRCGWTICTDEFVLQKVRGLREKKLPAETGGVLIGSFDLERHIVYVADVVPSPIDSQERPDYYIRGVEGLQAEVERISAMTLNNLEYVGEWHSHPHHIPAQPSNLDLIQFDWIDKFMSVEGLPAVMLIVADEELNWLVERPYDVVDL